MPPPPRFSSRRCLSEATLRVSSSGGCSCFLQGLFLRVGPKSQPSSLKSCARMAHDQGSGAPSTRGIFLFRLRLFSRRALCGSTRRASRCDGRCVPDGRKCCRPKSGPRSARAGFSVNCCGTSGARSSSCWTIPPRITVNPWRNSFIAIRVSMCRTFPPMSRNSILMKAFGLWRNENLPMVSHSALTS